MKLWGIGQISPSEKNDILSKHRELYNGYRSMYPELSNTQPLYVQDFANDKGGITVNNRGEVKKYTNMGINEQVEEEKMCEQCGGQMTEGLCEQCGSSMEGEMGEEQTMKSLEEYLENEMGEGKGHLDDIYHEEDLNPSDEFDYVKGATNKTNAFHVKEQKMNSPIIKISAIGNMEEQGGNADDMDVDDVQPAYDFVSDGPMNGGDVYPVNEDGDEDFKEYETMESAWEEGMGEEIQEVDVSGSQGIYGDMESAYDFDSEGPGKGGPYQEFNYESEMEEQYPKKHEYRKMLRKKDALSKGQEFDDNELDISDYKDDFDSEKSSWEDISKITGDDEFGYVDEDIRESVENQRNKVMEMMNRMKIIK